MIQKFTYDINRYPFRELFCKLQCQWDLENVHRLGGFEAVGDQPGNDNNSCWHNKFYEKMRGSHFILLYKEFIRLQIQPIFNEAIVYQRYPTLRYQIPGGKGVAAYHVDSDYNHPIDEFNIWLPLTNAYKTNSIYIESEPGKGDYESQDVCYGDYLIFEGGKLSHGNEINQTDETRVSIDFRIIPQSKFQPSEKKGLHYGRVRSTEGEDSYYEKSK